MPPEIQFDDEDTGTSFNEAEFDDPEADAEMLANEAAVEEAVAALEEPAADFEVAADYMGEVERRLDIASYWRELLASPIFEDGDENAQIVESELRQFATSRLQVLMGLKKGGQTVLPPPPAKPLFSEEEAASLRAFITLAPDIAALVQSLTPSVVEVLVEVAASVQKRRAEAAKPAEPKPRPVVRTKPAPAPAAPKAPAKAPAPAPKTPPKPTTPPPAQKPRPPARPTLARRGKAATPAAAPAPAAPTAPAEAPEGPPADGRMHPVRPRNHGRVQGSGPVPFPRGREEMEAASASFAAVQSRSLQQNADNPDKATDFVGIG